MIPEALQATLEALRDGDGRLTLLTGAGISAESGIPTFRGPEGYWQVGSANYTPQEIGTWAMFRRNPTAVWLWYLFRRTVCEQAQPNAGHHAVVAMEEALDDRFRLITQNVDGLHLRAGNHAERTFHVHGSLAYVRCSGDCEGLVPFPQEVGEYARDSKLTKADRQRLHCPQCGSWFRPHVLWFDEFYDEQYYRFESALAVAKKTQVLITVGTTGATNLPVQAVDKVLARGGLLVDVNIAENAFGELASERGGHFLKGPSGVVLPAIAALLR